MPHTAPADPLGDIAGRRGNRPVPYRLTDAAHAALDHNGPSCPGRVGERPCLHNAGHRGGCDPMTGGVRRHLAHS